MVIDAVVDERSLREIYLSGFERAVKAARPWTVMCSYNRLGGDYCSENARLLTEILRDEWGFEGLVVSDWGAVSDRVRGLAAGLDIEMPSSGGANEARIVAAVRGGSLDEAVLDRALLRILDLVRKADAGRRPGFRYDREAHHALARRAAAASMVLLKNEGGILPLRKGARLGIVGAFAKEPRYQGSGSSIINPWRLDSAFDAICGVAGACGYAPGYSCVKDRPDEGLIRDACDLARGVDLVLVFAGLTEAYEMEGLDRAHLRLPASHDELIRRVAQANSNCVVLLSNGAPVEMPWIGSVRAALACHLGGQAAGSAVADILFGAANPSGKLAESYPLRLEDTPSFGIFPGGPRTVEYRESVYVGYRYYEAAGKPVLFPFGHGLGYGRFEYSALELSSSSIRAGEGFTASLRVRNVEGPAGAEVVQLYVRDAEASVFRPEKELKGFAKVFLGPGEERRIEFALDERTFAYYDVAASRWLVEAGEFEILVGASSADIRARAGLCVEGGGTYAGRDLRGEAPDYFDPRHGDFAASEASFAALLGREPPPNEGCDRRPYAMDTALGDMKASLVARMLKGLVLAAAKKSYGGEASEATTRMARAFIEGMPLRALAPLSGGLFRRCELEAILLMANGSFLGGLGALLKAIAGRWPARHY
jgi:beta-glucosidase